MASPGREGATLARPLDGSAEQPPSDAGQRVPLLPLRELGYSVPTGLNIAEVEIAQARDLDVDSLPVWLSRTDFNAAFESGRAALRLPAGRVSTADESFGVCFDCARRPPPMPCARLGDVGSPDAWIGVPYTIDTFVSVLQYEF